MSRSALAILLALALGCRGVADPTSEVGHYTLRTIGGRSLPIRSTIGAYYWGGSIELRSDSSFVDVLKLGDSQKATVVDSVFGRYVVDGDSIRMTPTNWDQRYVLHRFGRSVTVVWAEGLYIYQ